uniref:hypothetical protein n=1 Tax=Burkholderia cenocepacia TaxID=95486 RepID=UPI000A867F57
VQHKKGLHFLGVVILRPFEDGHGFTDYLDRTGTFLQSAPVGHSNFPAHNLISWHGENFYTFPKKHQ